MIESSDRTTTWQYDSLYRLTNEDIANDPHGANGNVGYGYDAVGNREARTGNFATLPDQDFEFTDNDWLTNHTYDSNGNTLQSDGHTDVYDFMNRLIRRTTADGQVIDIIYNADGDRVTKTLSNTSTPGLASRATHYHVDRNNLTGYAQVLEELDSSLTVERVYTYGLDLIAQHQLLPVDSPTHWETSYYLYDGLGSVRTLADETGTTTDAYFYDAYGNLLNVASTGPATPNVYLFTGEQWDVDLGMYFLRARYLNPQTGRFHTMDSFEGRSMDPQTLHKYLYVHANPIYAVDPSGRFQSLAQQMVTLTVMQTLAVHLIAGYYIYAFDQALVATKLQRAFKDAQEECGNRECVQFAEKAQEILKNSKKKEGQDWEIIQYEAPIGALWLDGVFAVEGFGRFGRGKTDSDRQVSENAKHVGIKIIKGIGAGTISDNNILFAPDPSWRIGYEVNPRSAEIMTIQEADSLKNYSLYGRIKTTKSKDLK